MLARSKDKLQTEKMKIDQEFGEGKAFAYTCDCSDAEQVGGMIMLCMQWLSLCSPWRWCGLFLALTGRGHCHGDKVGVGSATCNRQQRR